MRTSAHSLARRDWPAADEVCVHCRRVLTRADRCVCRRPERVAVDSARWAGGLGPLRTPLMDEGGGVGLRRHGRGWDLAARASAIGLPGVLLVEGLLGLGPGAYLLSLLGLGGAGSFAYLKASRQRSRAVDVSRLLADRNATRWMQGVVREGPTAPAPITGEPAVAFAIELRGEVFEDASGTLLRQSTGLGFTVDLSDGQRLWIPAGAVELSGVGATITGEPRLERHLESLFPRWQPSVESGGEILPHDSAAEVVVRPGDTVIVSAPIHERLDPDAPASYREAAPMMLVADQPVVVELVDTEL